MQGIQKAAIRRTPGAVGAAVGQKAVLDDIDGFSQALCDFRQQLEIDGRFVLAAADATAVADERDKNVVFAAGDDLAGMGAGGPVHDGLPSVAEPFFK
jgi:hypothetical protein